MNFQRATKSTFLMVAAGALATYFALTVAMAQSRPAGKFDPLNTYVGTWVATNPGESAPFLVLRLSVVNAELQGTMSHFSKPGTRTRWPVHPGPCWCRSAPNGTEDDRCAN